MRTRSRLPASARSPTSPTQNARVLRRDAHRPLDLDDGLAALLRGRRRFIAAADVRRSRTRRIAELRDHCIVDFDRAAYRASHIALSAATNYRQRDPTVIRPTFYTPRTTTKHEDQ